MTLVFFVLIQYRSVTDGQTDRRTDRQTDRQTDIPPLAIPAVCLARYANALVKTVYCGKLHETTDVTLTAWSLPLLFAGTILHPLLTAEGSRMQGLQLCFQQFPRDVISTPSPHSQARLEQIPAWSSVLEPGPIAYRRPIPNFTTIVAPPATCGEIRFSNPGLPCTFIIAA